MPSTTPAGIGTVKDVSLPPASGLAVKVSPLALMEADFQRGWIDPLMLRRGGKADAGGELDFGFCSIACQLDLA